MDIEELADELWLKVCRDDVQSGIGKSIHFPTPRRIREFARRLASALSPQVQREAEPFVYFAEAPAGRDDLNDDEYCVFCWPSASNYVEDYRLDGYKITPLFTHPATEGGEAERYLANGIRCKVSYRDDLGHHLSGLPESMAGRWVAFVAAEDDSHLSGDPCKEGCQYAKDIGMLDHHCAGTCMYSNHPDYAAPPTQEEPKGEDVSPFATGASISCGLLTNNDFAAGRPIEDVRTTDDRDSVLGAAINRACRDLPEGYDIHIYLEKDAGTLRLYLPDGDAYMDDLCDGGLAEEIDEAITTARMLAKRP